VELIGSKSKIKHIDIDAYAGNIIMDNSRAKEVIGWSPKINLIQGLKKTLQRSKEENK
jgi:nucleoside-diphosphate-sugar epimerase